MTRRTYGQLCGLARALDLVGERWTALIVRDLAVRPRRFTDLQEGLPGIGTGLLSERMQHLEAAGVVERRPAPRPERGVHYTLTERGRDLADALMPLARWGLGLLSDGEPDGEEAYRAEWLVVTLRSLFDPARAAGVHDCYVFDVMGERVWATVDDGELSTGEGDPPRPPDMVLATDPATLAAIGCGAVDPATAASARSLEVFAAR